MMEVLLFPPQLPYLLTAPHLPIPLLISDDGDADDYAVQLIED